MTTDERNWVFAVLARGDQQDPAFVRLCEAQLREDFAYLRARTRLREAAFEIELLEMIIARVEACREEMRDVAIEAMREGIGSRFREPRDSFVRDCAKRAFQRIYPREQAIVLESVAAEAGESSPLSST